MLRAHVLVSQSLKSRLGPSASLGICDKSLAVHENSAFVEGEAPAEPARETAGDTA